MVNLIAPTISPQRRAALGRAAGPPPARSLTSSTSLNEGLLSGEQRAPVVTSHPIVTLRLNEGLLSGEQRGQPCRGGRSCARRLNEGLLSGEQRGGTGPFVCARPPASTKGCSRESSGSENSSAVTPAISAPQRRAAVGRAAGDPMIGVAAQGVSAHRARARRRLMRTASPASAPKREILPQNVSQLRGVAADSRAVKGLAQTMKELGPVTWRRRPIHVNLSSSTPAVGPRSHRSTESASG